MHTFDTHGHIIYYTTDQASLYIVVETQQGQCLLTLLLPTLEEVDRRYFNPPIYFNSKVQPFVDDSFLYLPAQGGQILKLDKFSGTVSRMIDVGAMEITSIVHSDENHICCLCGIPLRVGKNLTLSNFSICQINKNTGKKTCQSRVFSEPTAVTYAGDFYLTVGSTLMQMTSNFELLKSEKLAVTGYMAPVLSESHVICTNEMGAVEIFSRENLKFVKRMLLDKTVGQPAIRGNEAVFFASSGVHVLNLETGEPVLIRYPVNSGPKCIATELGYFAIVKNRIAQYKDGIITEKQVSIDDLTQEINVANELIIIHDGKTVYALHPQS